MGDRGCLPDSPISPKKEMFYIPGKFCVLCLCSSVKMLFSCGDVWVASCGFSPDSQIGGGRKVSPWRGAIESMYDG